MTNNMENIMDEADLKVDDYLLSLKLKRYLHFLFKKFIIKKSFF